MSQMCCSTQIIIQSMIEIRHLFYSCKFSLCCHPVFCVCPERRSRYRETLYLLVPSIPIVRGLTPPDVAVQQGKDQETQSRTKEM